MRYWGIAIWVDGCRAKQCMTILKMNILDDDLTVITSDGKEIAAEGTRVCKGARASWRACARVTAGGGGRRGVRVLRMYGDILCDFRGLIGHLLAEMERRVSSGKTG